MSVLCSLRKTGAGDLTYLRDRPDEVARYLFGDAAAPAAPPAKPRGILGALGFGWRRGEPKASARICTREAGDIVALEKSWEVIDYLLTGSLNPGPVPLHLFNREWPVAVDVEIGYGKPMVVDAPDIGAFADALADLSDDDLMARFDPVAFVDAKLDEAEAIASHPNEAKSYLSSKLAELRRFSVSCKSQNAGAILYYH